MSGLVSFFFLARCSAALIMSSMPSDLAAISAARYEASKNRATAAAAAAATTAAQVSSSVVTASDSHAAAASQWACAACTFLNLSEAHVCGLCDTVRSDVTGQSEGEAKPLKRARVAGGGTAGEASGASLYGSSSGVQGKHGPAVFFAALGMMAEPSSSSSSSDAATAPKKRLLGTGNPNRVRVLSYNTDGIYEGKGAHGGLTKVLSKPPRKPFRQISAEQSPPARVHALAVQVVA